MLATRPVDAVLAFGLGPVDLAVDGLHDGFSCLPDCLTFYETSGSVQSISRIFTMNYS
jgi:hypothetical protein